MPSDESMAMPCLLFILAFCDNFGAAEVFKRSAFAIFRCVLDFSCVGLAQVKFKYF